MTRLVDCLRDVALRALGVRDLLAAIEADLDGDYPGSIAHTVGELARDVEDVRCGLDEFVLTGPRAGEKL